MSNKGRINYFFSIVYYSSVLTCRVLEEISEVLGDRDYVTQEDIDQLKYMEQVC